METRTSDYAQVLNTALVSTEEERSSINREVDDILRARIAGNEAAAAERTHALITRGIESERAVKWAIYALTAHTFDESTEVRAAFSLLDDMISGWPTRAGVIVKLLWQKRGFSNGMRPASLSRLTEVAVQYPSMAKEVVLAALRAYGDDDGFLGTRNNISPRGRTARKTVDELMLRCPLLTKQVVLMKHENNILRKGVMRLYGRLFSLCPEETDNILSLVLAGCSDSSRDIREAAVRQLSAALAACPKRAREVVDALLSAIQYRPVCVKSAAISQFSAAVEAVPESSEAVVEALYSIVASPLKGLHQAALQQLSDITKLCPNRLMEISKFFIKDLPHSGREGVEPAEGFPSALQASPEMGASILEGLLRTRYNSNPNIRKAVVGLLCGLIAGASVLDAVLISSLFHACTDKDVEVRKCAVRLLVPLGKKVPQVSDACATSLFEAFRDPDTRVRCEALCQLKAAVETWPGLSTKIVRLILRQCCGRSPRVRKEAKEQLQAVLPSCPEEAIALLGAMLGRDKKNDPRDSGKKRKSCDRPCDAVRKKRRESSNTAKARGANTNSSESLSNEKSKKSKRTQKSNSEERKRQRPRRC